MERGEQQPMPHNPEQLEPTLDQLPERLGFIENDVLVELRSQIVAAAEAGDEAASRELLGQYAGEGERLIEEKESAEFVQAQLGFNIAMALVKRDAHFSTYSDTLYDAYLHADNLGYDEYAAIMRSVIDMLDA